MQKDPAPPGGGSPDAPLVSRASVNGLDFDTLFDDVFPALLRYCHRLTGDGDVAEDMAQEAFVRFVRDQVEGPPGAVRVWLFKVATHLIRDRYRTAENRRRLLEEHPVKPSTPADPAIRAERDETIRSVRNALSRLPDRDRQLLLMREEGFSYREISQAVGVKEASIGTLLSRAQRRFTDAYALEEPEGDVRN